MKILRIDDKWSIEYDPNNNDQPVNSLRYGEIHVLTPATWDNEQHAMFYALLERDALIGAMLEDLTTISKTQSLSEAQRLAFKLLAAMEPKP